MNNHRAIRVLDFLTAADRSYVVHGAGKFTEALMELIDKHKFKKPVAILDDAPKNVSLAGINVFKTTDYNNLDFQEVVLGTDTFQVPMKSTWSGLDSSIKPIDIFGGPDPVKLFESSTKQPSRSETAKVRDSLKRFCLGNGVDVGFGGDPIIPTAICMDLPTPYAHYQENPQHLHGDAQNLHWFKDSSLDYVYSSHVLEDFPNTAGILDEWLRLLRIGGRLVLFLPDEQTYRDDCASKGKPSNPHHIHEHFSMEYVKEILSRRRDVKIIHEKYPSHIYSFELVVEKTFA